MVPPEYGLTPPSPGAPRPQELAPESAARQILLGQRQAVTRTPGEQILAAEAGADRADPLARYVVDDEFGSLAHKEESWANRIMFWRKDDPASQAATVSQTSEGGKTIDAASERARLDALTGGREGITIAPAATAASSCRASKTGQAASSAKGARSSRRARPLQLARLLDATAALHDRCSQLVAGLKRWLGLGTDGVSPWLRAF